MFLLRSILTLFIVLVSYTAVRSQSAVALDPSPFSFTTPWEEQLFSKGAPADLTGRVEALFNVDPTGNDGKVGAAVSQIKTFCEKINTPKLKKKPLEKRLKVIFSEVHSTFFRKYELVAGFHKIFESGTYNCVSGTALYALVLDELGINYNIIEEPAHVYLVAEPGPSEILVESTDPRYGIAYVTEGAKQDYVKMLVQSKMVTEEEYNEKGYERVFSDLVGVRTVIDFKQVAAIQYFNEAIVLSEDEKLDEAVEQCRKAYALYESEQIKLTLMILYASQIDGEETSLGDLQKVLNFVALTGTSKQTEALEDEFRMITSKILIQNDDLESYIEYHNLIHDRVEDTAFLARIDYIYNYERCRAYLLKNEYKNALPFAIKAMEFNSKDLQLKSMFKAIVANQLQYSSDPQTLLDSLGVYAAQHPFLANDKDFNTFYCMAYLDLAIRNFEINRISTGNEYLLKFEELYVAKKVQIEDKYIGAMYKSAWGAYIRKGSKSTAKKYIERGLVYAPYSIELNQMLEHH
jgi:hypothetical protein